MSDAPAPEGATGQRTQGAGRRLARDLGIYTLARIGLVIVIAAVIMLLAHLVSVRIPLVVAALFALLIAMPLSMTLFKRMRTRVNEDIAVVDERRRRDKAQLRARLRGADGRGADSAHPAPAADAAPGDPAAEDAATGERKSDPPSPEEGRGEAR
ncbi:DUF4229 domain-containing protein [Nocardia callitridis]|uniref:DUF4229 domain-containing protein n=1 Tax=Nocardia callitridis TaxID=648753 RepID=A0ABP9JW20_9NOCA